MIVIKADQNPHLTAKDCQEHLEDSVLVVYFSTVQQHLHNSSEVIRRKTFAACSPQNSALEVCKGMSKQAFACWKQVF